jgi:hypothetical protein
MSIETRIIKGEINRQKFEPKCSVCPGRWGCVLVLDGITGQCNKPIPPKQEATDE